MNGTGATIDFDGTSYNVDSTKLYSARNAFVSHLDTIAGNGSKVSVGGVEYGIDSTKLASAISEIEAVLAGTGEERLEGDGAEFYTLAPTALSFRSTAPLNELQEVQINGVTVDPANYTLEEGSTIVTFPIDYLKTLNVGNYEVAVASEGKTVKGGFTVVQPELNEHGFYYNQPYSANLPMFGGDTAFFVREDGTYDIVIVGKIPNTGEYTMDGNNIVASHPMLGTITCTISSDGTEVFCNELQTTFKLSNSTTIVADEDYIYTYREDFGGYEVQCIDKTKANYGAIKTGINEIPTVALGELTFVDFNNGNENLLTIPYFPETITTIGDNAFKGCTNLRYVERANLRSITSIGSGAFADCISLERVNIPDNVITIGAGAFRNTNLPSIIIPDSVVCENTRFIGECSSIQDVYFGNGLTGGICDAEFRDRTSLLKVVIGNSMTFIGYQAFIGCTNLHTVLFNENSSMVNIGSSAFYGCSLLTTITIPKSVTSIGKYAFHDCKTLRSVNFEGTVDEWNAITKGNEWNYNVPATYVQCSDGQVSLV